MLLGHGTFQHIFSRCVSLLVVFVDPRLPHVVLAFNPGAGIYCVGVCGHTLISNF